MPEPTSRTIATAMPRKRLSLFRPLMRKLLFRGEIDRTSPAARPRRLTLMMRNGTAVALPVLAGTCGLLGASCGRPELPRCDATEGHERAPDTGKSSVFVHRPTD